MSDEVFDRKSCSALFSELIFLFWNINSALEFYAAIESKYCIVEMQYKTCSN